jgi:uncharacterized membrane protein
MMSQNRQAATDRLAAALDYEVNVKAEAAIAELHDKVDRLTELMADRERGGPRGPHGLALDEKAAPDEALAAA